MSDDIQNTIEVLAKRVAAKEEEANKLKKLVNELCAEAGISPRYPNVVETGAALGKARSDQYYGQPLTAAIRGYLEQRKAAGLGAASLEEIYSAVRDGGYKFESKNESNARTSVGNTLRKSSSIFHRIPTGQYGLLVWYPGAKSKPEEEGHKTGGKNQRNAAKKEEGDFSQDEGENQVSNQEIREVILAQTADFTAPSIEEIIKAKYPNKHLPNSKVSVVAFLLKKKGLLKVVSEGLGSRPAVYAKA